MSQTSLYIIYVAAALSFIFLILIYPQIMLGSKIIHKFMKLQRTYQLFIYKHINVSSNVSMRLLRRFYYKELV